MSYKYDAPLVPGAYHYGGGGLGVFGSNVPSTGLHGPSYLYNDLTLPADADKEVRGLVETPPAAGTFFAYEDGSFDFVAPDGSYTFVYRLYVDGIDSGTATVSITLGGGSSILTGDVALGALTTNGGFVSFGPSTLSGEVTLDGLGASGGFYGDQPVNLGQDYPGWVVRAYINGGQWWRP